MQIPVGNFGNSVAAPAGAVNVPRQDDSSGVDALNGVASASIADAQARQIDLMKQQNAAKAALALATNTNQMKDAHDQVAQGVMDGSIAPEDAQSELSKRTNTIMSASGQGLTQQHTDILTAQLSATQGDLERSIGNVVFKQQQSNTAATIDETGDQLMRQVGARGPKATAETYSSILDFTGASAGLTPAQIQMKKSAFAERSAYAYFDGQGANAYAAGDAKGVGAALEQVQGPDGDAIDPTRRAQLTHTLAGYQNALIAQGQRDEDRQARLQEAAERQGEASYKATWELVASGKVLDATAIQEVSHATAGTSWAPLAGQLLQNQSTVARFATMTQPQRTTMLDQMRSVGATPGQGTDPQREKIFGLLEKIDSSAQEAARANPWQAALQYGVIQSAAPMQMNDPGNAPAVMQQRMRDIDSVEAWVGHKVSPLQPQEAEDLAKSLRNLPADQAATVLSSIGGQIGDPERAGALAKQMGDKDGTMGLAMAFAGNQTTSGRLVAELVIKGDQVLKDKTSQDDTTKQTGWRAQIATAIRGAYPSPQAEDAAIDAALKVTAAREVVDNAAGDIDTAVKLVTGGVIQHGAGKTVLPYGMHSVSDFDDALGKITPQTLLPQVHVPDVGPSNAPGMVAPGNIDLRARPMVKNADGTISTVRSIGIEADGKQVLIPTVSDDGRIMSNEEAMAQYRKSGRNLGTFATQAQADAYGASLHDAQAKLYANGSPDFVIAGNSRIPLDAFVRQLPNATLMVRGPGQYAVMSGKQTVTNTRGEPILLSVQTFAPPQVDPVTPAAGGGVPPEAGLQ